MSKDTINPKRWILDEKQIKDYYNWCHDRCHRVWTTDDFNEQEWLKNNPCPLPESVNISNELLEKIKASNQK